MAKLSKIKIEKYKSIDSLELSFPKNAPLVLVGENNAGKSNILQAINIILGETYPKSFSPDDNDFYYRDPNQIIKLSAFFSKTAPLSQSTNAMHLKFDINEDEKCEFVNQSGKWPNNEERDNLLCILVNAERNLSYQLSYKSKYTLLIKLMHKFHSHLIESSEVVEELKIKFGEIKDLFYEVEEFQKFSSHLKKDFSGFSSGMTHSLDIDFSAYDPTQFFRSLRLQADENGEVRTLAEVGTGEEQILALALAHSYAKAFHRGVLLAIEEPEAHLHPLAQEYLYKKIGQMCTDGLQLILTTHSPAFINIENTSGLALVRKSENGTFLIQKGKKEFVDYCVKHGSPKKLTTVDNIAPFYSANSTKEIMEGVFAKKVVLVEGPTESLTLPIYFNACDLNTRKENIAVIPVHGKGNISKWWRFFTLYNIPTYIIFDNDTNDNNNKNHRKDILNTIGISDLDSVLDEDDLLIKDTYAVFGLDYEACLRVKFPDYSNFEDEAKKIISSGAKPFTARYVARELVKCRDGESDEDGWKLMNSLVKKISNLSVD